MSSMRVRSAHPLLPGQHGGEQSYGAPEMSSSNPFDTPHGLNVVKAQHVYKGGNNIDVR